MPKRGLEFDCSPTYTRVRVKESRQSTRGLHRHFLKEEDSVVLAVAIVVVVIPIAVRMPATLVFIPPSMTGAPAVLPRFV